MASGTILQAFNSIAGRKTVMKSLDTSATNYNYEVPETGWYTVGVSSGATAGILMSRLMNGNNEIIMSMWLSAGQYDNLVPSPMFFQKGATLKATAMFPTGGSGGIFRIT